MVAQVYITPICKKIHKKNKISGHQWTEYGSITGWVVHGLLGVHSRHRTEAAANKEAVALQAFYDKFFGGK